MKRLLLLLLLCVSGIINAQIVNIPDVNFKNRLLEANSVNIYADDLNGNNIAVDANGDGEIQVSEALNVGTLVLQNAFITDLTGIEAFSNLMILRCSNNSLSDVDLTQNLNLEYLSIGSNQLSNIDLTNNLQLDFLSIATNEISNIDITQNVNLKVLNITANPISNLDISQNVLLEDFRAGACEFSTIDTTQNTELSTLYLNTNQITNIDLTQNQELLKLYIYDNQLTEIDLSQNVNLENLRIYDNQLANLDVTHNQNLLGLWCFRNQLTSLDVTQNHDLIALYCSENLISNLDVTQNSDLYSLECYSNVLSSLDVSQNQILEFLNVSNQGITEMDISNNSLLEYLWCSNNNLISLITKNGSSEIVSFNNNPNLEYVCADDEEIDYILSQSTEFIVVNSYCSFAPGGNYNTIEGNVMFDLAENNCNTGNIPIANTRVEIDNGNETNVTYTNAMGEYTFYTESGSFMVSLQPETSSCNENSVQSNNVSFANDENNTSTVDFCVAPVENCNDVEVVIFPFEEPSPGFDIDYGIIFKNKGSDIMSGTIEFMYDDSILDYVSSSLPFDNQTETSLFWNYSNLLPFETRMIVVTLNLNSPMEDPAVNIDDELYFEAIISPTVGDYTIDDNYFKFKQLVVGSFDPNDITCLEGDIVDPEMIGEYLHYNIRFENTGTAPATFVVVANDIDESKYNLDSFQIMHSSHEMMTRVTNNKIEFIFDDINLEPEAMGNVVFKIRSLDNLNIGDSVAQQVNIFFDYNFPIETNIAATTFEVLSVDEFTQDSSVSVYPNPTDGQLFIDSQYPIESLELYDIQGRKVQEFSISEEQAIDLTNTSKGIYFLRIQTDKGTEIEKLIKS